MSGSHLSHSETFLKQAFHIVSGLALALAVAKVWGMTSKVRLSWAAFSHRAPLPLGPPLPILISPRLEGSEPGQGSQLRSSLEISIESKFIFLQDFAWALGALGGRKSGGGRRAESDK